MKAQNYKTIQNKSYKTTMQKATYKAILLKANVKTDWMGSTKYPKYHKE